MDELNIYVEKYGEEYRLLIEDALKWLDQQEWKEIFDKDLFLQNLIS